VISSTIQSGYATEKFRTASFALASLICLANPLHAQTAAIYKTYDAQGNVVFTDQPVDQSSAELIEQPVVNVADPLPLATENPVQEPSEITDAPADEPTADPDADPGADPVTVEPASQVATPDPAANTQNPGAETQSKGQENDDPATSASSNLASQTPVESAIDASSTAVNDDSGNVAGAASQEPASTRIALPVVPEGARAPSIGTATPTTQKTIRIQWPAPDEVLLSTQSPIWVELESEPPAFKAAGLVAEVWLDDNLVVSGARPLLPLTLPEIGLHKLQVRLVDAQGNSVAESDSQLIEVRLGAAPAR